MDRHTRNLFALALVLVIAVTGGAAILLGGSGDPPPSDALVLDGVIVGVDAAGLDQVRGFSLRTTDGTIVEFTLAALQDPTVFPPGHLVEHQATAQAVRVWYRTIGPNRVAIRLEDAP
jgi:hypothetical protein